MQKVHAKSQTTSWVHVQQVTGFGKVYWMPRCWCHREIYDPNWSLFHLTNAYVMKKSGFFSLSKPEEKKKKKKHCRNILNLLFLWATMIKKQNKTHKYVASKLFLWCQKNYLSFSNSVYCNRSSAMIYPIICIYSTSQSLDTPSNLNVLSFLVT